jgi:hypothetical protein
MKAPVHSTLKVAANAAAFAGVFVVVAGLIGIMYHYTRPGPVDQARWVERTANLAELNAHNKDLLENYGWVNPSRGVVRLPVDRALELTVKEWQDPAAGRSNLLARMERALPPTPAPATTNAPAGTNPPLPFLKP